MPEIWNEAIIILLHKKGDQKNISNYRPISLLNNIYKLFTKIITNRITRTVDENQPREQAGFRRGFSTIDHLHAVNQLIEKCAEYKIPLAFDSVEIPDVIEALQEQGVDPVYVNVLKHIYKQAKSFIRLHKDSKPVIPKVGRTPHRWARRKFCGAWRFFSSLPKKKFLTYLNRYKGI